MCPNVRHDQYRHVISVDEVIKKDTEFFQTHKIQKKKCTESDLLYFYGCRTGVWGSSISLFFPLLGSKRDECPSGYESFRLSKTKLHAP